MPEKISRRTQVKLETENSKEKKYILRLFVTGILPNSVRAIKNIKAICNQYLKGIYELEIIDIYQQPDLALTEEIIAVPILIKKCPLPEERIIGDLSNIDRVLLGLDIVK